MNIDEKHNHAIRFRRFQQSREKFFAPLINRALHKQYLTVINSINLGVNAVNLIDSARMALVLKHIYLDAGIIYGAKIRADFAKEGVYKSHGPDLRLKSAENPLKLNTGSTLTMVLKSRGAIGFSERMHQLITDYFKNRVLITAEIITQTTRDLITKVFMDAYSEGLSINEIVKKLESAELSKVRARRIARTETVKSANWGAWVTAKETGLKMNKTWLAAKDNRTRDTHKLHTGVDGHTVDIDDFFNVGGYEMLIPGDEGGTNGKPAVSPSEFINCRCTCTYKGVRDASGRLIRA